MPSLRNAASDTRLRPSFLGLAFAGKSTTLKSECVIPVVVSLPLFPSSTSPQAQIAIAPV